jgi:kinesin family member 5
VFDQLLEAASASRGLVNISVSYLQIYCELVTDLLDPRPATLSIREKPGGNIYVENLSEMMVTSYSDVKDILERGERNRCTAATNTNATSSRSHAAILIKITTPDDQAPSAAAKDGSSATKNGGVAVKESTLVLVDLAGSERSVLGSIYVMMVLVSHVLRFSCCRATAVAGRNYLRAEESKSINLSLSALGNCIAALSSSQQGGGSSSADWRAGGAGDIVRDRDRVRHIPYRDSKLTRLLQVQISLFV